MRKAGRLDISATARLLSQRAKPRSAVEQVLGGAPVRNGQPSPPPGRDVRQLLAPAMQTIQADPHRRMLQWVIGQWPALTHDLVAMQQGEPRRVQRQPGSHGGILYVAIASNQARMRAAWERARLQQRLATLSQGKLDTVRVIPANGTPTTHQSPLTTHQKVSP